MVTMSAVVGWIAILWLVWLAQANWAVLSKTRGGVGGGLRRGWAHVDNKRFMDLGGFVAGLLFGPTALAILVGFAGGLLGGVSLGMFGLTISETLMIAAVSMAVAFGAYHVRT